MPLQFRMQVTRIDKEVLFRIKIRSDLIRSAVRFFSIWIEIFYSDFESNHQYSVVKIIFEISIECWSGFSNTKVLDLVRCNESINHSGYVIFILSFLYSVFRSALFPTLTASLLLFSTSNEIWSGIVLKFNPNVNQV